MLCTKVEKGFSGGKFFAYFGANNPLIAVAQKPTYTLFATAVGGRCVEKVNAAFASEIAARYAAMPKAALAANKRCIAAATDPARDGYADEISETRALYDHAETRRKVSDFLAKRLA